MATLTVGMAEAKTNFSRITANVNATGIPVTVFRNNKPWVEIRPLASDVGASLPKETLEALDEANDMLANPGKYERYESAEALFKALNI